MQAKEYQYILVSTENRIATITINRPDVSNAIDRATIDEIRDAFKACVQSEDVGVIVFTGNGKNFCAGGNLKNFKETLDQGKYITRDRFEHSATIACEIKCSPKPTIAMINGAAAGAGAALATACDFRIFAPSSKFVMSFINVGLPSDTGAIYFLSNIVGSAKSLEIMMTGKMVRGEEAFRIGLANILAEEGTLSKTTYDFASKLAHGPSYAYECQKKLFQKLFFDSFNDYEAMECVLMEECTKQADFKEAVNAFLEKRPPRFGKNIL